MNDNKQNGKRISTTSNSKSSKWLIHNFQSQEVPFFAETCRYNKLQDCLIEK